MHPVALALVDIPENLPQEEIGLLGGTGTGKVRGRVPGDQALQGDLRARQQEPSVLAVRKARARTGS